MAGYKFHISISEYRGCYLVVESYGGVECGGGALLDRPRMVFQRMCVLCLWSQCASRF